jgi:hypothetical protein
MRPKEEIIANRTIYWRLLIMIEFVWPLTNGEWLAWISAFYLVINGMLKLLIPRWWLNFFRMRIISDNPQAVALMRGPMGGGNVGLGIAVLILHPQPLLYLALGSMFVFMAIGRLISIMIDKGNVVKNWIVLVIEGAMGFFPLAYAFGLIA